MFHIRCILGCGAMWLFTVAGCGGTSTGATDAGADATITTMTPYAQSCDLRPTMKMNMLYCQEFVTDQSILSAYKSSCVSAGGVWSDVGCNRTGALGGCKSMSNVGLSTVVTINWFYAGGFYTSSTAIMSSCASSSGTYVSP